MDILTQNKQRGFDDEHTPPAVTFIHGIQRLQWRCCSKNVKELDKKKQEASESKLPVRSIIQMIANKGLRKADNEKRFRNACIVFLHVHSGGYLMFCPLILI